MQKKLYRRWKALSKLLLQITRLQIGVLFQGFNNVFSILLSLI